MLSTLFALSLAVAPVAHAQDDAAAEEEEAQTKIVKVPDLPVEIELPTPDGEPPPFINSAVLEGGMLLEISRLDDSTQLTFGYEEGFQPFFDKGSPDAPGVMLQEAMEIEEWKLPEEWKIEVVQTDNLGHVWTASGEGKWYPIIDQTGLPLGPTGERLETNDPLPVYVKLASFATKYGSVGVMGWSWSAEQIDPDFDQVLAWTTPSEAAVALSEFSTGPGRQAFEAGWSMEIPEGWRAFHDEELKILAPTRAGGESEYGGARSHTVLYDLATPYADKRILCSAIAYPEKPVEVVDPEKSAQHGQRYTIFAKLRMRGGKYKNAKGEELGLDRVEDPFSPLPVKIEKPLPDDAPEDARPETPEGTLSMVSLGDRDGYIWETTGIRGDQEIAVAAFGTAWDELGLDCYMVAPKDDPSSLEVFKSAMATVQVTDGVNHPHNLGARGWYRKNWPFTHPALQIWWFVAILLGLGIFLAFRSED